MRAALVSCVLLSACAGYQTDDDVVDDDPLICDRSISLDGGSGRSVPIGPAAIGPEGTSLCVHLDGTANLRNHFAASTDQEAGLSSSFELVLLDADGGELRVGWDVTIGSTEPRTFASVEWQPAGSEVVDVILRATPRTGTGATTTLRVAFFDPLE